jgi:hypothetical protein
MFKSIGRGIWTIVVFASLSLVVVVVLCYIKTRHMCKRSREDQQ